MSENEEYNNQENTHENENNKKENGLDPITKFTMYFGIALVSFFILFFAVSGLLISGDDCDVPYADYDLDGELGVSDYDTMRDIEDDAC